MSHAATADRSSAAALTGRWRAALMALGAGAVMTLAHAPVGFAPALLVGLALMFWLIAGSGTGRRAAWLGWCAGVGYFASGLFWIVEPFLVDVARHGWMAPFALVFMAGGLALFWIVPAWLTRRVGGRGWAAVLLFAGLLTIAEYARTHVLTGFPWALFAYGWLETPVAQGLALFGPHTLGFLSALAGALLLARIAGRRWPGPLLAGLLLAAGWGYGAQRVPAPAPPAADATLVRLVQPNAAQHLKWHPDYAATFFERQLAASAAPAERRPDVIVWPEAAVPWLVHREAAVRDRIAAAGQGAPVILGTRRAVERGERADWFNSLAVVAPSGAVAARYDKHHLVPFGEYLPLRDLAGRLGLSGLAAGAAGGFRAGPGPQRIAVPGLPAFLPLICYEAIFPHAMQAPGPRPAWLLQVTNDAWFGTLTGPYQHLAQARARAIEQGLPLARAANTGVSAMVDPYGRIRAELRLGVAGHLDAALPPALPPTLYAKSGDLPWMLAILAAVGAVTVFRLFTKT
ncbi:MAG: apolipoprotein N-acyltransferase [Pseudomonadota bacterium]